jgi:hypothetical protein
MSTGGTAGGNDGFTLGGSAGGTLGPPQDVDPVASGASTGGTAGGINGFTLGGPAGATLGSPRDVQDTIVFEVTIAANQVIEYDVDGLGE